MVTATLLASAIVGNADRPKIAFVSREYYPYPSKRISYPRLRICEWDGSRVRILSPAGQECHDVAWAGPRRLVYWAGPRNADRTEFSHWTIDLTTGKSRRIAGPEFDIQFNQGPREFVLEKGERTYTVTPSGKVVPFKPVPPPWRDPSWGKDEYQKFEIVSRDAKQPGKLVYGGEETMTLTGSGKQVTPARFFNWTLWWPEQNAVYLNESYSRGADRLYRVDWATTQFKLLCDYGFDIDWRPDRRKFAFSTPQDMFRYGPTKSLWCSELWVGDLSSGISHPIRRGEIEVWAVAVQPQSNPQ